MNAQEIKKAVDEGKKVYWGNPSYKVIKDAKGQYLIKHDGGHVIGLTWSDGTTLNGKEEDFYIGKKEQVEGSKNIEAEENEVKNYSKGLDALKYEVYTVDTGVTVAAFENTLDAEIFVAYLNDNVTPSAIRPIVKANIIKAEEGYQGYKNYETWNCHLWLGNEQGSWEFMRETVIEGKSEDEAEWKANVANILEEYLEESMPDLGATMWGDLLQAAFDEIDFYEIAEWEINEYKLNERQR